MDHSPFQSFFMGGFECSSHRPRSGRRLDLIAATGHDAHAAADYAQAHMHGLRTVRDGIRWHLIEQRPGRYTFASVLPMLRAAQTAGVQVVWDLCHYGWPDDIDIFKPAFVQRFAGMVRAFAAVLAGETDSTPVVVPVNEVSFLAWAGGETGAINPFGRGRGDELKAQLIRAAIAGIEAIRDVIPDVRIASAEPLINVVADPARAHERAAAEGYRLVQYQVWDMLCGREAPQLGGDMKYLDLLGVNYYPANQWYFAGPTVASPQTIERGHRHYRPLRQMLREVHERYGRPVFIAETGCEDDGRAEWLRYVGREARGAMRMGVPVAGLCLYPILDYPGWDDDRHCHTGLWGYCDTTGARDVYQPLARELRRQRNHVARLRSEGVRGRSLLEAV